MKEFLRKYFQKLFFSAAVILLLMGLFNELSNQYGEQISKGIRLPYTVIIFLGGLAVLLVFAMLNLWLSGRMKTLYAARRKMSWMNWILILLVGAAVSWLFCYSIYSLRFEGLFQRISIFIAALYLCLWLAARSKETALEWRSTLAVLVFFALVLTLTFAFRRVVDYPFGQYWSEGNRFYDYSVLYGSRLYDYPADQPLMAFIDIGRQSLWGLPFLFADINIWQMRFWYELVFVIPSILLGWIVLWPKREDIKFTVFFSLWTYLFLNQGPIYSPLVLAAILAAATRRTPAWLGFLLTGLAGYYARMTRFTWAFAPAIWAALLAFLESEPRFALTKIRRWGRAILYGVGGLLGGYVLPEVYNRLYGATKETVGASIEFSRSGIFDMISRQPLIWSRLWPNETYDVGIVLGLLLAAGLVMLAMFFLVNKKRWALDFWQKLALFGSLFVFLAVGLVISVKIGGGSNLHNLDMFLLTLYFAFVLGMEAWGRDWLLGETEPDDDNLERWINPDSQLYQEHISKRIEGKTADYYYDVSEIEISQPKQPVWWVKTLLALTILLPALQILISVKPLGYPTDTWVAAALEDINMSVAQAKDEGEVLFIDHRQLLTFGYVTDVPLVSDYEKKLLMDTAMAGDEEYFNQFYTDLAEHRFSLILTEPLFLDYQGGDYNFGDENDAWVKWVSRPVLCYYEEVSYRPEVGLMILKPKPKSAPAEEVICPEY